MPYLFEQHMHTYIYLAMFSKVNLYLSLKMLCYIRYVILANLSLIDNYLIRVLTTLYLHYELIFSFTLYVISKNERIEVITFSWKSIVLLVYSKIKPFRQLVSNSSCYIRFHGQAII